MSDKFILFILFKQSSCDTALLSVPENPWGPHTVHPGTWREVPALLLPLDGAGPGHSGGQPPDHREGSHENFRL